MRKLCRVLFSRYAVSALCIVAYVALLTFSAVRLSAVSRVAFFLLFTAFDTLMLLHLINRDTSPEYKLPWAVLILSAPFLGALLYALFFRRKLSARERRHLQRMGAMLPSAEERTAALGVLGDIDPSAAGKALAILRDDPLATVCASTSAVYYGDGAEMFRALLSDLCAAERYIFIETFLLEDGVMWRMLHDVLRERVAAGVEVRLLYDDVGCMRTLPSDFDVCLRAEGIEAHRFAPISPRVTVAHNNRDHRKLWIIDGRVAYTGGINIADEYIHARLRFGEWKDGGIRLYGDAAMSLCRQFLVTYGLATYQLFDLQTYRPAQGFVPPAGDGVFLPFGSGPYPLYRAAVGKNAYLNLIRQSERYLYITTPYLIVDHEMTGALISAARRGVDVRILTPHIPDKRLVFLFTRSSYAALLSEGVRIYEFTPGFLHEKLLVSDDRYGVVGTINLDYRSFAHHFEDAVLICGGELPRVMRDAYMQTQARSHAVTEADARLRLPQRLLLAITRLFAPLL